MVSESNRGENWDLPDQLHPMRARVMVWGSTGWRIVGLIVAAYLVYALVIAFSGLIVPLVFAMVVAALGVPVVDRLERMRVPRPLGALSLITVIIAIVVAAVVVVVRGIVEESNEIRDLVVAGTDSVRDWVSDGSASPGSTGNAYDDAIGNGQQLIFGAASWWTTIFSSALAFAIGIFLSLFMLYYLLVDWARLRD